MTGAKEAFYKRCSSHRDSFALDRGLDQLVIMAEADVAGRLQPWDAIRREPLRPVEPGPAADIVEVQQHVVDKIAGQPQWMAWIARDRWRTYRKHLFFGERNRTLGSDFGPAEADRYIDSPRTKINDLVIRGNSDIDRRMQAPKLGELRYEPK